MLKLFFQLGNIASDEGRHTYITKS